jgi:hypothetical protein
MFASRLRQQILTTGLAAGLVGGTLALAAQRASAQMQATRSFGLSPNVQQTLYVILGGLPPHGQRLVLKAIRRLEPDRAEMQLAQARAMHPETLRLFREMVVTALQGLPAQYHEAFIDGLFQVSSEGRVVIQWLSQVPPPDCCSYRHQFAQPGWLR